MKLLRRILFQSMSIVLLSAILALAANAVRPDAIPLIHAESSAVDLAGGSDTIEIKDAAMLFASGRALFLDARTRLEYNYGHIRGALSLPPDEFGELYPLLAAKIRQAEILITYCDGERCPLSHELAEKLTAAGLVNVRVLVNGWTVWTREQLPTETGGASLHSAYPPPSALCPDCGQ
ncbi:MAG: rhodanese-like domain-containing protein [Pseudodesulfovibrio sp.]|uniref:Rhodanese domain protein n=1 Tax=Pseudodesulfovibrio aespoeensis (strain ATCC 700646 / DSM 10631 / Aspo-2) TaxID=643562 RepID=E6VXS1_PSEA9|nr:MULTISPECIES: rhodanese-like domain-containing protein [Pseudodesulfovibrio]MBU4193345.1 rhodanese-like domain-containing protein [Pseudomonadota bacterium]MBV1737509.1 rhodanese-like domain-containing protein [Desulfarculus sp.]ADU61529.1 Rhodanese domain protein [Pseudodesulfovibrio aespoeensis Aspo-2]MBU4244401.1 rhodanese-like domain-containing protein [Pseudomonadota bacterium]MBU4379069.1 rhodanese-like domain-containing protein [Pseudomonadota bacterium]